MIRSLPLILLLPLMAHAQERPDTASLRPVFDAAAFADSERHWYAITDEERVITPQAGQKRYPKSAIREIAENILLFQKANGGWPKNYDMRAILSPLQKKALAADREVLNTTIDNGATHSQIEFLARAGTRLNSKRYLNGALRGIDFLLSAQYPNGGWPQFYPQSTGYSRLITYNDGAMIGVMELFHRIVRDEPQFRFLDAGRRERIRSAFGRGVDCILRTQIVQEGVQTAWCQQHDEKDLSPRSARMFEPAAVTAQESAGIVRFLMALENPSADVVSAVQSAVRWFARSRLAGIRVQEVAASAVQYQYHATESDRIVVEDPQAPPIWARFYELGTNRPLFCNRDGKPVYSLAEVERERRTGYAWYTADPASVLAAYRGWREARGVPDATRGE